MNQRFSIRALASELLDQFNLQKGLLRTFIDLTIRPGTMLQGYLDGSRRAQYTRAITYLVLSCGLLVLIRTLPLSEELARSSDMRIPLVPGVDPITVIAGEEVIAFFTKYLALIAYASLPFLALITKFLFRSWQLNYIEHLVINAFIGAHGTFLAASLYLCQYLFQVPLERVVFGVYLIWMIWAFFSICWRYGYKYHFGIILRSILVLAGQGLVGALPTVYFLTQVDLDESGYFALPDGTQTSDVLVGTWSGTDFRSRPTIMTFESDGSFEWVISPRGMEAPNRAYRVLTDVAPMLLYLTLPRDVSNAWTPVAIYRLENDNNTLVLCYVGRSFDRVLGGKNLPPIYGVPSDFTGQNCISLARSPGEKIVPL